MTKKVDCSVVVPVYRSVDSLEPLFEGIVSSLNKLQLSFEVLFIEDSNSDESWNELLRLKGLHSENITIIRLSKNFGQNGATLCGIDQASGERIVTIDDDLQTPPEAIEKLFHHQKSTKADVLYGKFDDDEGNRFRKWGSNTIKRLFKRSEGAAIGSSFRLIEPHIVEKIKFHSQDHLFINQVISWYTLNIKLVPVPREKRTEGRSGYSIFRLVRIALQLIFYYTSIPIKIMIAFSILTAIGIFGLGIYYVFYQLENDAQVDLFLITVLVAMAIISASISVFGVYINRIYASRVKKPSYAIKVKM